MSSDEIQEEYSFNSLLDLIHDSLILRDFAGAAHHADLLVRAFPMKPQGFMLKAQALTAQGRTQEALEILRSAMPAHRDDPKFLSLARSIAFQHGGFDEAIDFAVRLSEITPVDRKNLAFLIQWHLHSGDVVRALMQAEAYLGAFPDDANAVMLKVQALVAQDLKEEAVEALRSGMPAHERNPKFLSFARNISFQHGRLGAAIEYASKLSEVAPGDPKNQLFLAQFHLASGNFREALFQSETLIALHPGDVRAFVLQAQALVALQQVDDALRILRSALADYSSDQKLLRLARTIAFEHGRFDQAIGFATALEKIAPDDDRNRAFLVQSYMASGNFDAVSKFIEISEARNDAPFTKKAIYYLREYKKLKVDCPAIVEAWEALGNPIDYHPAKVRVDEGECDVTMIQYWSQGRLPDDVAIVFENWKNLLGREGIGSLELFDRAAAEAWIGANAPAFSTLFSKAFHYAMEADIFRIAYASRKPCIYMDVDCWPLEHTAEILRFGSRHKKSMLYFRSHRPWINNCFFISNPHDPFFKELGRQCLEIDLDRFPKDHRTIEMTFGPTRYNKVLRDVIGNGNANVATTVDVPGCSVITMDGEQLYFAHEAAIASVKPPFALGYKATDAYWKGMSKED